MLEEGHMSLREELVNSSEDIWGVWTQYVTLLPSHIWLQNATPSKWTYEMAFSFFLFDGAKVQPPPGII